MIELSLDALIDNFPASRAAMPIHAARFNELFRYRWARLDRFLKLHYVLSRREEPYWMATREAAHGPQPPDQLLARWPDRPPPSGPYPPVHERFHVVGALWSVAQSGKS